jgi:hypothetical protein
VPVAISKSFFGNFTVKLFGARKNIATAKTIK